MNNTLMYGAMAVTGLSLAAMLGSHAAGFGQYSLYFKMLASTAFITAGLAAGGLSTGYGRAVLLALFFSWWGDLFLGLSGMFLYGLVAFLLGHIFFAVAFLVHGVDLKWIAAVVPAQAVVIYLILRWLGDGPGDLQIPVYAYIAVISAMVALSFGAKGRGATWWVVAGAVLFYVSDIFVARQRFVSPGPVNGLIGLPLYFAAQVVFAYTCKLVR